MRMCEALAGQGHTVRLVGKRQRGEAGEAGDLHACYGVAPTFEVETFARPGWRGGGVVFTLAMVRALLRSARAVDLVYSRDLLGGAAAAELGLPVVYEAHGIFEASWQRTLWRRMLRARSFRGLVAISEAMVRELAVVDLLPPSRPVVVAHSPAELRLGTAARTERGTPPRIGYVGSLYPGRGIELVLELAARLPAYAFEVVGGTEADLARWRASRVAPNVTFRGFVAPGKVAAMYGTFDVLLMPYPHHGIHGPTQQLDTAAYCSPMKMFEYMASGVPIIASDLPVLQEVLVHGENALVAPSGDAAAWQTALESLIADRALGPRLATRALADVAAFTPEARVRRIFTGLGLRSDIV